MIREVTEPQLSHARTKTQTGTILLLAGHRKLGKGMIAKIFGGVVSCTVTVVLHTTDGAFRSLTEMVTVCLPSNNDFRSVNVVDAGGCVAGT